MVVGLDRSEPAIADLTRVVEASRTEQKRANNDDPGTDAHHRSEKGSLLPARFRLRCGLPHACSFSHVSPDLPWLGPEGTCKPECRVPGCSGGYPTRVTRPRPAVFAQGLFLTVGTAAVLTGCLGGGGYGESVDGQAAPGGHGTVTNRGEGAFSQPAANLSEENLARFRIGDTFFIVRRRRGIVS